MAQTHWLPVASTSVSLPLPTSLPSPPSPGARARCPLSPAASHPGVATTYDCSVSSRPLSQVFHASLQTCSVCSMLKTNSPKTIFQPFCWFFRYSLHFLICQPIKRNRDCSAPPVSLSGTRPPRHAQSQEALTLPGSPAPCLLQGPLSSRRPALSPASTPSELSSPSASPGSPPRAHLCTSLQKRGTPRTLSCVFNATHPSRAISPTSTATCPLTTSRSMSRSCFSWSPPSSVFFLPFFPASNVFRCLPWSWSGARPWIQRRTQRGSIPVPGLRVPAICCLLPRVSPRRVPQKQCDIT